MSSSWKTAARSATTLALFIGASSPALATQAEVEEVEEIIVTDEGDVIIVDEFFPVPEIEFEVIVAEPEEDTVWIGGYWDYQAEGWDWQPGHWDKPPHENARWANGYWKHLEGHWHWHPGHWYIADRGYIVDEWIEIPGLLEEVRPERPSHDHHWVAGYWEWDGRWIWVPGYWTIREDPKAEWVPGHWDPFGEEGKWRWIDGHWNVR